MLSYEPGDTFAHRLDPRSKLAFQMGFAAAALAHTGLRALAIFSAITLVTLTVARVPPGKALYTYRYALVLLVIAPLVSMIQLTRPWIALDAAIEPARASFRVLLILLVSTAYIRTTRVRESQAAIQRTVPGKAGQLLGTGVALVFRTLPLLLSDLRQLQAASAVRLGTERGPMERAVHFGTGLLSRAFVRADRLALALQARCFAWNPTLPELSMSRADIPVLVVALVLLSAVVW